MIKFTFGAMVASLAITSAAHAAALLTWNFNGVQYTGAAPYVSTGNSPDVTPSALSRTNLGTGSTGPGGGGFFVGADGGLPTGGIDTSKYVSFFVTPNSGKSVSVTDVTLQAGFQDNSATSTWELRSSADSFASTLGTVVNESVLDTTAHTLNITTLNNISTPLEFRLYPYGAANGYITANLGYTTNANSPTFIVDGTSGSGGTPVPEPASLTLLGVAGTLLLNRRKR